VPCRNGRLFLWVIREPLVHVLFQRGEFNEIATRMTAEALGYFALGLWALASFRVLVGAWYALDGAYVTVWAGVGALAINVILSVLLIGPLGHSGLALAVSIAAIANVLVLMLLLRRRLGGIQGGRLLLSGGRCLFASSIMAGVVQILCRYSYDGDKLTGGFLALGLGCWVVVGILIYLGCIMLLGVPEGVKRMWKERRKGRKN
jgi:putative peptidoglycan lipid II flippase